MITDKDSRDPLVPTLMPMPIFPVLDSVRAIGALAVLVTHVAFEAGSYTTTGVIGLALARLDVGVAIFFVLSGFLLSYPWLARAADRSPRPGTGRYLWKRVLRIWPVYAVTTVIALGLVSDNKGLSAGDWVTNLLLADIYVHPHLPAGLTQMWSLTTELAFYVVLPLLMLLATGRRLRAWRVVLVLALMWVLALSWLDSLSAKIPNAVNIPVNNWLPAYLDWFAMGIGLALAHVLYVRGRLRGRVARGLLALGGQPGACWVAVAGLMLLATTPIAGPVLLLTPTTGALLTKNVLYAVIGALVVLPGVFGRPDSTYHKVMRGRTLRHLGHISYSVFCIHLPVLLLVMWLTGYQVFGGHFWVILGLTLLITLPAAELLYRLVEMPSMRLRGLGSRDRDAVPSAPPKAASTR